jgi:hypothetical protein
MLARSPDPADVFVGSPALAKLPSGRLIATYEWFRRHSQGERSADQCEVLSSDDGGANWMFRSAIDLMWASPFALGDTLYLIGNDRATRAIAITRSDNGGASFSPISILFQGRYTNAPTAVCVVGHRLYRAFEHTGEGEGSWSSLVVCGDTRRDLMDRGAWRISNAVPYPGTPPALTQGLYPPSPDYRTPEDGWLEGNVVEVRGELFVLLRLRIQTMVTGGICGVCRVQDDGITLTNRFAQFQAMPGAQSKFHIIRDGASGLYWTCTTPTTDPFQRPEPLWARGFRGSPGNERRALVLMYSLDALDWFMAGFVALSADPLEAYSYASLLIDGDDMLVLARTSLGGRNQHDTNLITLHRVRAFRDLVPDAFQPRV